MATSAKPFNLSLLKLTPENLKGLRPVRSLDIFDNTGVNFHPDGLYSVLTFGKVGSDRRQLAFSYIDVKMPILHPLVFKILVELHPHYFDIMSGRQYAVWDEERGDLIKTDDIVAGKTGYAFFFEHWRKLKFEDTGSYSRSDRLKVLANYADAAENDKIVVLPAGLRDLEENNGRFEEDEVNTIYRRILSISNSIPDGAAERNPEFVNVARWNLQLKFNELYEYFRKMIDGKHKLVAGKWASRRTWNTTRNVLSAMVNNPRVLGDAKEVRFNNTVVGLYQAMKSLLPIAVYNIRNGYLSRVFRGTDQPVRLVDAKTLRGVEHTPKPAVYDAWLTDEGIEQLINIFANEDMRHKPVMIGDYYLSLTYLGTDGTFKFISDIDDVPESRRSGDIHPTTWTEFFYGACYRIMNNYPVYVTRFPVTGLGSIYPAMMYVKTTIKGEVRTELDEFWQPMENATAIQWPVQGERFINSLIPHTSRIKGLNADYDGDMGSTQCVYSDEAVAEVKDFLTKRRAYIGPNGNFLASINSDVINFVFYNMTGVENAAV